MSRPVHYARDGHECSECKTLFSATNPNWYVLAGEWLHACWADGCTIEHVRGRAVRGRAVPPQKETSHESQA